jgi:hypothetical protein
MMVALVTWAIAGCAGPTGTIMAVTAANAPTLAGTWQGSITDPAGKSFPATLTVRPDSTYMVQGGAFVAQGKAQPKDGHLQFVSTSTTGGLAVGERTGSAVLMDQGTGWAMIGSGQAPAGPFNFEFRKPK